MILIINAIRFAVKYLELRDRKWVQIDFLFIFLLSINIDRQDNSSNSLFIQFSLHFENSMVVKNF